MPGGSFGISEPSTSRDGIPMLIFFVFIHGQTPPRYASITGGFTWIEARDAFARISPIWGALVKFFPGGYSVG